MDMAVVATPAGYTQWKNAIEPAMEAADMAFLSGCDMWYSPGLHHEIGKVTFDKPTCIVTGRQDNSTGYKIAYELVERFPRATFAVMDAAGHLLERDTLYRQLMVDWLERIDMEAAKTEKSRCPS
jgi:pimeloyl-ACP methyl ester carboxylesterase